jgi:hypothetical protein
MFRQLHGHAADALAILAAILLLTACGNESRSDSEVKNCELLTDAEVSEMAGFELVSGEDSFLGCPYTIPGDLTAQVTVGSAALDQTLRSRVEQGYAQAADIIDVDGAGEETFAVLTPTGATVAAIVTARDGRFVELGLFMLGIEPGDMARIRAAAAYAVKALERATD